MNNELIQFRKTALIVCAGVVLLIAVLCMTAYLNSARHKGNNGNPTGFWTHFSDPYIGVAFEHPKELRGYYTKEINFRDCEECPGFINIKTETVGDTTVEDIVLEKIHSDKKADQTIVKRTTVDGNPAIITSPTDQNAEKDSAQTIFIMHKDVLYTISTRWVETERFLQTLRFLL